MNLPSIASAQPGVGPSSAPQSPSSRPTSARGVPPTLADRVALYCRHTTVTNNAGVLRAVAKPTAEEMAEFLQQQQLQQKPTSLYGDVALVRVLLTDSEYDSVVREMLSLSDAIAWQCQTTMPALASVSPSPSAVDLMLQSMHVFTEEQIHAAQTTVEAKGLDSLRRFFIVDSSNEARVDEEVEEENDTAIITGIEDEFPSPESEESRLSSGLSSVASSPRDGEAERLYDAAVELAMQVGVSSGDEPASVDGEEGNSQDQPEQAGSEDTETNARHAVKHGDDGGVDEDPPPVKQMNDVIASEEEHTVVMDGERIEDDEVRNQLQQEEENMRTCEQDNELHTDLTANAPDGHGLVELESIAAVGTRIKDAVAGQDLNDDVDVQAQEKVEVDADGIGIKSQEVDSHMLTEDSVPPNKVEEAADVGLPEPMVEEDPVVNDAQNQEENVELAERDALSHEQVIAPGQDAPLACQPPVQSIAQLVQAVERHALDEDPDDKLIGSDASLLHRRYSTIAESGVVDPVPAVISPAEEPMISAVDDPNSQHESTTTSTPCFALGDAMEAQYKGKSRYFKGSIAAVHTTDTGIEYDVRYDDGDFEAHVDASLIRAVPTVDASLDEPTPTPSPPVTTVESFVVGEAIEARYRGWHTYFAGEIAVVRGNGLYDVRYSDGEYETSVHVELIQRVAKPLDTGLEDGGRFASRFQVGDVVEILYRGQTRWYPGWITAVYPAAMSTYDVEYEDADIEKNVAEHLVRPRIEPTVVSTQPEAMTQPAIAPQQVATVKEAASAQQPTMVDQQESIQPGPEEEQAVPTLSVTTDIMEAAAAGSSQQLHEEPVPRYRVGDRVRVGPQCGWLVGARTTESGEAYDVLYDGVDGDVGKKEVGVKGERIERIDRSNSRANWMAPKEERAQQPEDLTVEAAGHEKHRDHDSSNQASEVEQTPVVPFRRKSSRSPVLQPPDPQQTRTAMETPVEERIPNNVEAKTEDTIVAQKKAPQSTARPSTATSSTATAKPRGIKQKSPSSVAAPTNKEEASQPVLSESTMRYLTPQPAKTPRDATNRPKTPRSTTKPKPKTKSTATLATPSWKELEEWKNVDLILTRKRRIVQNGQVGGSDVPWGEDFAAIQSLKRFASQYPEVLRDHIEGQLQQVVDTSTTSRPMTTRATSAARDALLLVKDLAFLLRQRISPFLHTILPVVLPAVFHSQKRFLCDTAYEVLEALVAHCSSRKLAVALLKQALKFPREDLRVINLTCLYVEKCLSVLSFAEVQELMDRHASVVLSATAELLTCKSAGCQSAIQKSLVLLQQVLGEEELLRLVSSCLCGNAVALVQRHLVLADSTSVGASKSPPKSPKKAVQQGNTPGKLGACEPHQTGGISILQRMLAQRHQNRVLPAPE